jgi:glutamyl-tRNA synthetase
MSTEVRTRIAPSPTGTFHLGSARTALFNWLWARHNGGRFLLRIEDTDRKRLVPESLADITSSLRWLGLDWDEGPEVGGPHGPYVQSERLPLYTKWTDWLLKEGKAYRCYCSEERLKALHDEQVLRKDEAQGYDRHCRYLTAAERAQHEAAGDPSVVRFAMPTEGQTTFTDILRPTKPVDNNQIGDRILVKSDGFPVYHLAVVIDDHDMEITHIMRGDEWLSSVPLHVNLYSAFGWNAPVYAHLPLILDPSGQGKLSKRKKKVEDGEEQLTYIREFKDAGYLPDAMFNFLAILGWSYSPDTDLFTREQAIEKFDIRDINASPGALPAAKLDWMNGHYIRQLGQADLTDQLVPFLARDAGVSPAEIRAEPGLPYIAPLVQERIKTLDDAYELVDFVFDDVLDYPPEMLVPKGLDKVQTHEAIESARAVLSASPFTEETLEPALRSVADSLGIKAGQMFSILRVAITGKQVAPPLFGSMLALGQEEVVARCGAAAQKLNELA